MAERWTRRHALYQAISVVVVIVAVVIGFMYAHRRPQGPDSLKAEVSVLRSQAAEAALVLESSGLYRTFLKAHAQQLAHDVEREQDRIAQLHLEPRLRDGQRFASHAAQRLHAVVQAATDGDVTSQRTVPRVLAGELEVLEHSLQR